MLVALSISYTVIIAFLAFMAGRNHQHGLWLDWYRDNIRRDPYVLDLEMFNTRPAVPGLSVWTERKDA